MQIWKSLSGTDHLSDKRFHLVVPQRESSIHGQIDEHHVDSGLSAPRLRTQRCATVKGQASVCTAVNADLRAQGPLSYTIEWMLA
jgi:hypothetical protein